METLAFSKIGIIGSGTVAQTLGAGFLAHGYQVMLGTRNPAKLDTWLIDNSQAKVGSNEDAAEFGDLVLLAVQGSAAIEALRLAGATNLRGKVILDATNPIDDSPPDEGVLGYFTTINHSLMETLQSEFPEAKFVKVFNSVGAAAMVNPEFAEGRPTMFICGNDEQAKKQVQEILDQFGWDIADMGGEKSARAIEPLCMLWCIPGFLENQWTHAFKLLKR